MYRTVELRYCTLATNMTLYVNSTIIKIKNVIKNNKETVGEGRGKSHVITWPSRSQEIERLHFL